MQFPQTMLGLDCWHKKRLNNLSHTMNLEFWKVSNAQKSALSAVLKIAGLEQVCAPVLLVTRQGFPCSLVGQCPWTTQAPTLAHTPLAGASTLFLIPCAACFRFEIADRPARPLHPVRAAYHMLSIYCLEQSLLYLPGLAYHSSSVSSSSDILPCPPPTRSLIL